MWLRPVPLKPGPYWVFAAGVLCSLALICAIPDDVFFSGDGGVKWLLVKQFAEGRVSPVLSLDAPAPVREAWAAGLFPLQPPFVYATTTGHVASFPLTFALLSAPLFRLWGYRGLYVLPALGVWCTWLLVWRSLQRLGVSSKCVFAHVLLLVFCTNSLLFAAAFWEHSLAIAIVAPTFGYLLADCSRDWSARKTGLVGALLGLSFLLRSELMLFALLTLTYVLRHRSRYSNALLFSGMTLSALGCCLVVNQWIYGTPLGLHSEQVLADSLRSRAFDIGRIAAELWAHFFAFVPSSIVLLAAILMAKSSGDFLRSLQTRGLLMVGLAFLACAPVILPNAGGKQIGPRYLLVLTPAAVIVLTEIWSSHGQALRSERVESRLRLAWLVSAVAGFVLNMVYEVHRIVVDYRGRIFPALQYARAQPEPLLCVTNSFIAQELAALFAEKQFLLLRSPDDFPAALRVAEQFHQNRLLVISAWEGLEQWRPSGVTSKSLGFRGIMEFHAIASEQPATDRPRLTTLGSL